MCPRPTLLLLPLFVNLLLFGLLLLEDLSQPGAVLLHPQDQVPRAHDITHLHCLVDSLLLGVGVGVIGRSNLFLGAGPFDDYLDAESVDQDGVYPELGPYDDVIYAPQSEERQDSLVEGYHREALPFPAPDILVRVDSHNQVISECPRLLQELDVSRVQQVEATCHVDYLVASLGLSVGHKLLELAGLEDEV